ncbi:MAG: hypothetical protein WDW38_007827 [Sanguina aurantia]
MAVDQQHTYNRPSKGRSHNAKNPNGARANVNRKNEPDSISARVSFGATTSNHRCCAERLLLDSLTREARRHGFRSHHVIAFVRRKAGPDLSVWRQLSDGAVGCAAPCVLCHRAICNFGLRVHCPLLDGTWFSGRLTDDGAPPGVATSGQARAFKFGVDSDTKRRSKVKATAAGVAAAGVSSGKGSGGCSADDGACDGRKSSGRGQSEVGAGSDACCTSKQRSQLQRQVRGRQKQQEQQLGRRKGGCQWAHSGRDR